MRTTLDIERKLLDSVVAATREKTKSKAVNAALKEYIRRKHVQELIDSWGKIIVDDYSEQALEAQEQKRAYLGFLGNAMPPNDPGGVVGTGAGAETTRPPEKPGSWRP